MDKKSVVSGLTLEQLNAFVEKLGGHEVVLQIISGELLISKSARHWREQDGIIRFSVTSNGMTGEQWITHLESRSLRVEEGAKQLLTSLAFKPTSGVTTDIAVLNSSFFSDDTRSTTNIRAQAKTWNFCRPNAEVACLIRAMFTDAEFEVMGFGGIVAMHDPIEDSDHLPRLLSTSRRGGGRFLGQDFGKPDTTWRSDVGFAFAVPQAGPYR